jgi:hypothetical protein
MHICLLLSLVFYAYSACAWSTLLQTPIFKPFLFDCIVFFRLSLFFL